MADLEKYKNLLKMPPDERPAALAELGFPEMSLAAIEGIVESRKRYRVDVKTVARLLDTASRTGDPARVIDHLDKILSSAGASRPFTDCLGADDNARALVRVVSGSRFLAEHVSRHPEDFVEAAGGGRRLGKGALGARVLKNVQTASSPEEALARERKREILAVYYRDAVRDNPFSSVVMELSTLAEVILEAALALAWTECVERFGAPRSESGGVIPFSVIAMGKLGGRELNYSSDIDLVFVYGSDGVTDSEKPVDASTFFIRLGSRIISLLDAHTPEGRAYRVDMRLRPLGSGGPLALPLSAYEDYYHTRGSSWERQALIKARLVAGDLRTGSAFMETAHLFAYPRYLDSATSADLRALKSETAARAAVRQTGVDVKKGPGTIRDIESLVQFLQILSGGMFPSLRQTGTLPSVNELVNARSLSDQEADVLREAYTFFREVEHECQIMDDRQTHELPSDRRDLTSLAVNMGFAPGEEGVLALRRKIDETSREVKRLLNRFFFLMPTIDGADARVIDFLASGAEPGDEVLGALGSYGFREPREAYRRLVLLSEETNPLFRGSPRTRQFFLAFAPRLLSALARTVDPDMALANLEAITGRLGAKSVFYQLLAEEEDVLELFVTLSAWSYFLVDVLSGTPGLFDELVDALLTGRKVTPETLREGLGELGGGREEFSRFVHFNMLLLAIYDIAGENDLFDTATALSGLADAVVGAALGEALENARLAYGEPGTDFAVLGLGKLGAAEMSYASDLDIIFVYDQEGKTDGGRERAVFFSRVARDVTAILETPTPTGPMYRVDLRLRPDGRKGAQVISLDRLRDYYMGDDAAFWELAALTRMRVVTDYGGIKPKIEEARKRILSKPFDREALAERFREMKRKIESGLGEDNFKKGPGGIMDVEYVTQFLSLVHGAERPELLEPGTVRKLDLLHDAGILSELDHMKLVNSYMFLRILESRLVMVRRRPEETLPEDTLDREKLAWRMHYQDGARKGWDSLRQELAFHMAGCREIFERLVK